MVIRALALAGLAFLAQGCLLIPLPRPTTSDGIRPRIGQDHLAAIEPGVTRRRDTLLILGEPDARFRRGDDLIDAYAVASYRMDVKWGLFLFPSRGGGIEGSDRQASREVLLLRFGGDGLFKARAFRTMRATRQDVGPSPIGTLDLWDEDSADTLAGLVDAWLKETSP